MLSFIAVLIFTVLVEISVAFCLGYKNKQALSAVVLVNLITNPSLSLGEYICSRLGTVTINAITILCSEALIVIVEWGLLKFALRQRAGRLFILSLSMNTASYFGGTLFFHYVKI
jgi:hypothetical protein